MSEEKGKGNENSALEEKRKSLPRELSEEEEVQELMAKTLKEQAEIKIAEAQPISKQEFEEEMAKLREENEDMRDLLGRAKAQHRAVIRQREQDKTAEIKKLYKGTIVDRYI